MVIGNNNFDQKYTNHLNTITSITITGFTFEWWFSFRLKLVFPHGRTVKYKTNKIHKIVKIDHLLTFYIDSNLIRKLFQNLFCKLDGEFSFWRLSETS